ncbi:MAG: alpha/beta hydrolase [Acidimicrobiales bacterium]
MTDERTPHELEYSPSSCIPSLEAELAVYAHRSADVAGRLPSRDLVYGDDPSHRVVVFEAAPGAPLHVFVHGGYWQALGAADSLFPAAELLDAGRSFAAVDYTLAPAATIGTIIDQCVAAVELVVRELAPSHVTVSGSSAGAHLAAHVAQRARVRIDRLILLSGIYLLRPLVDTYVNDALGLDESSATMWSVPLDPRPDMQVLVLHGEHETAAFKAQSARLAASWGVPTVEVVGRNHFDVVHDLAAIDLRPGLPTNPHAVPPDDLDDPVGAAGAAAERPGAPRRLAPEALHPA